VRLSKDVSQEELGWSPSGLRNSLSWILRRCAGLLWGCYAQVSGQPISEDVRTSGLAPSVLKGVQFASSEDEESSFGASDLAGGDLVGQLESAWDALKAFLTGSECGWHEGTLIFERRERSIWALLWHNMADIAYHTGQASSLRKLLSAQRRRN